MNTTEEYCYRQAQGLEVHEAEDGLIMFNAGTDRVYHLNPTAGVLFELCGQPQSVSGLIDSVPQLYQLEEPPTDAVRAALAQLVEEGALEEVNET